MLFRSAEDGQTAVTVHVLQGEREVAAGNKSLGRFDLADIPPAPRGVPQIEVAFDIDANGILNVSARDKATGKEQSIVIRASSGLSDGEIEKMVKDAEAHAEEDRKFHELVDARNQADGLIHATRKALKDLGDQVEEREKSEVESKIEALETAMKGDDKDDISARSAALAEVSGKLAERVYKQQGAAASDGAASEGKTPPRGPLRDALADCFYLGAVKIVEPIDEAVDFRLLCGGVGLRVGCFRCDDLIHEADEGTLLLPGYSGDGNLLDIYLFPPERTHARCRRGAQNKPMGKTRIEDGAEKFEVFSGEYEGGSLAE